MILICCSLKTVKIEILFLWILTTYILFLECFLLLSSYHSFHVLNNTDLLWLYYWSCFLSVFMYLAIFHKQNPFLLVWMGREKVTHINRHATFWFTPQTAAITGKWARLKPGPEISSSSPTHVAGPQLLGCLGNAWLRTCVLFLFFVINLFYFRWCLHS